MRELPVGATVVVRAPASSANLGPGFDSIGLALGLWDTVEATVTSAPGLVIEVSGSGADSVPRDESHLVYRSMIAGLRDLDCAVPDGVLLRTGNEVPHGRGLGSSATAIVAGVVAAHGLSAWSGQNAGEALQVDLDAVNDLAARLEGHPDNSSAAVYGGMTLSWTADPDDAMAGRTRTVRLAIHPEVTAVVFVPETTLATHTARALLPERVPLRDAVANSARAALLVEAATRSPHLLAAATRDWLHTEARRPSYPASMALVDALREQGFAATISGAGPSVLALAPRERAQEVRADPAWRRVEPGVPSVGATVLAGPAHPPGAR